MITQTVTSVCDVAAISVGGRPRTARGLRRRKDDGEEDKKLSGRIQFKNEIISIRVFVVIKSAAHTTQRTFYSCAATKPSQF